MAIDSELAKRKLSTLIVDDNEHMRALLRRLLHRMGIASAECGDGSAAMAAIQAAMPDFILTDLSMQGMDGISFVRTLRQSQNDRVQTLPVIMITGHAERHHVEGARDAGLNELLVKPVTEKSLRSRVQEIILRPRPFIFGPGYYGPCRRRRPDPNYNGPERRKTVVAI